MKFRVLFVIAVCALTLMGSSHPANAAQGFSSQVLNQTTAPDNDGDGLLDDYDLDDDNDGVMDVDDPEPFNPAVPGNQPVPGPTPPGDAPPADPEPEAPPAEPAPYVPAPEVAYEPAPVVTALPSTGTGVETGGLAIGVLAVVPVLFAGLMMIHLRVKSKA